MAKKCDLIIKSTDTLGNEQSKTYGCVNPNATAANIDTSARAINGLTTNTYKDTLKVTTESVNELLSE